MLLRWIALTFVFLVTSAAWLTLGAVTSARTREAHHALEDDVTDLWGGGLTVTAPELTLTWVTRSERRVETVDDTGRRSTRTEEVEQTHQAAQTPASARVTLDVADDVRRKGLVWFPLYDLRFEGTWSWTHTGDQTGTLVISWPFPSADGFYDDFQFEVGGAPVGLGGMREGTVVASVPVVPGQEVQVRLAFRSRGNEHLVFQPGRGVGELRDLDLTLTTDFADLDFPPGTLSPSTRERDGDGWRLGWRFASLVTGKGFGVVVPRPVQPGELAASMALSAPFSLGLFMVWIVALGLVRRLDVHPVHHALLAAAFFAFHLLFAYAADHLPVEAAFGLAAVVSVALVVSYLRLVVGPRFALREAGLAQLLYLVGFGLAHFWDGLTGLTLTVLGVVTLFALMQLTARVRWTEVFGPTPTT